MDEIKSINGKNLEKNTITSRIKITIFHNFNGELQLGKLMQ